MRRFPFVINTKSEVTLILAGMASFATMYYSRTSWGTVLGLILLFLTGIFWGYTVSYVNPMTTGDFRFIERHWLLYATLGLLTGATGWGFRQIVTKWLYGRWLPMDYKLSVTLVSSILAVAIAEEVFFRGYLLTRMSAFTNKPWIKVIAVCVLWGLYKVVIHIWEERPIMYYIWLVLTETYLTIPLMWWAYRTGSIFTPLTSHIVWDLLMYGTWDAIPYWVF